MKHTLPKSTAPAAHTFAQTMTSFEHTLYANFHHIQYLPIVLFVVAFAIVLASFTTKHSGARAASYLVAILLVVACVVII